MILGKFQQQPRERIPYSISYDDALSDGDQVVSVTATITPPDGVLSSVFFTDARVRVFVSGLTQGVSYSVEFLVHTGGGTIFEDEIHIKAKELT